MQTLAPGATLIDLRYLDQPGHIASCILETGDGLALVDPGPTTALGHLQEELSRFGATVEDVRVLLLTHIHLDHSGVAGTLTCMLPRLRVHVHERGAPHLADPARLLASATRIYGDQMDRLWGEVAPVPPDRLRPLAGGERLTLGGRVIRVAYTPGHAWHHVSYLDEASGTAFTGDVLGEQPPGTSLPIPVTPPPDIDVEEMVASGHRILAWRPDRLFVTHFGTVADPISYVRQHEDRLHDWSVRVRDSLDQSGSDADRAERFAEPAWRELVDSLPPPVRDWIRKEVLTGNWEGLARYWRKRSPTPS